MCSALFGGRPKMPEIQKVIPQAQQVTNGDIRADGGTDSEAARKKRAKQGYAATRLADTAQSGYKTTLG